MGLFYRAWTFPGAEACTYVADALDGADGPRQTLLDLAVAGANQAPEIAETLTLDTQDAIEDAVEGLSAAELYQLAILGFLVEAQPVGDHVAVYWALRAEGLERAAARFVYGEELDTLPVFYGDARFRSAWASLSEWGTSRRGWLSHADLREGLETLAGVDWSGPVPARGLANLEELLRTGLSRGHDLLITADP